MKKQYILATVAVFALAGAAHAEKPQCETNYKQEGSFFGGRRFSTWADVPGVSPDQAYKRIYTEMVKSGLKVATADKEAGILSAEQGSVLNGAPVQLPWNVVIERNGKGSKITVSKTTPGGYATGREFQMQSMCSVIDSARKG